MRWEKVKDYARYELELNGDLIVLKQWYDSGRDPNVTESKISEFNSWGSSTLVEDVFGPEVVKEILSKNSSAS